MCPADLECPARKLSWCFRRTDIDALHSLVVHGLSQLNSLMANHLSSLPTTDQRENIPYLTLFPLRRHVEDSYKLYIRLFAALLHMQRWRICPLSS